jgi:hypothetical protein
MAAPTSATRRAAGGQATAWDRSWEFADRWLPYVLLTVSVGISLLLEDHDAAGRGVTLALEGVAAGWITAGHTAVSAPRRARPGHGLV